MHKTLLAVGTLTALFALAAPTSAQMCGPGSKLKHPHPSKAAA
jgi:hypothetical protein